MCVLFRAGLLVAPAGPGCLWPHGCSGRRRPRPPARLGDLTSFGAAPRSPPVPSGPSGALHTSGAWCADVWFGASARCPARPATAVHTYLTNLACNSPTSAVRGSMKCPEFQRLHADACSACGGIACECVLIRTCHGPRASEISRVKPVSPLLAQAEPQMKPPSPLRERNGRFWCSFRAQW